MESYFKIACPQCGTLNIVNNGDDSDLTVADVDGVICWHCKHKWLLEGTEDWTDIDNANIAVGYSGSSHL